MQSCPSANRILTGRCNAADRVERPGNIQYTRSKRGIIEIQGNILVPGRAVIAT